MITTMNSCTTCKIYKFSFKKVLLCFFTLFGPCVGPTKNLLSMPFEFSSQSWMYRYSKSFTLGLLFDLYSIALLQFYSVHISMHTTFHINLLRYRFSCLFRLSRFMSVLHEFLLIAGRS